MVLLQLSATTWLINTKTLLGTSTILNISYKNITNVYSTFRSPFLKKVDFLRFWRSYPKFGYMVSLQLSAATWLINTKTLLGTSTILNISYKNITNVYSTFRSPFLKKVDFLRFWRSYPKFGYMVSLQLSAATWLINTKTLLRTSAILNISFGNITNGEVLSDDFSCQKCRFSVFLTGIP